MCVCVVVVAMSRDQIGDNCALNLYLSFPKPRMGFVRASDFFLLLLFLSPVVMMMAKKRVFYWKPD